MRQIVRIIVSVMVISLGVVHIADAQTPPPTPNDDQVNEVAQELYCPVCENIPLDVCGTQACEQWRGVIRDKLAQGWSKMEIKQYFVEQYGDRVLATPPARGFNWLIYIIPPLFFIAGIYMLFRATSPWKKSQQVDESPQGIIQNEYIDRLEDELKNR